MLTLWDIAWTTCAVAGYAAAVMGLSLGLTRAQRKTRWTMFIKSR